MRKGHSLSPLPSYLCETNTWSLSTPSTSPPCPLLLSARWVNGAEQEGSVRTIFWCARFAGPLNSTLAAWFVCTPVWLHQSFSSSAPLSQIHLQWTMWMRPLQGRGKMGYMTRSNKLFHLLFPYLVNPHNFIFYVSLNRPTERRKRSIHLVTHTELIWRHLQPIWRSFKKTQHCVWPMQIGHDNHLADFRVIILKFRKSLR